MENFDINSIVKIVRENERFWVIVSEILQNGECFGIINSQLITRLFKQNDRIRFFKNEIIDIWESD